MVKKITLTFLQILLLSSYFVLFFVEPFSFVLPFRLPLLLSYFVILLFITGLIIILFGILDLKVSQTKDYNNNTFTGFRFKGIYNYVKHPIYLGLIICLSAYAFYRLCIINFTISILLGVILYYKSKIEDIELESQYDFYKNYNKKTGRFFPKFRNRNSRS